MDKDKKRLIKEACIGVVPTLLVWGTLIVMALFKFVPVYIMGLSEKEASFGEYIFLFYIMMGLFGLIGLCFAVFEKRPEEGSVARNRFVLFCLLAGGFSVLTLYLLTIYAIFAPHLNSDEGWGVNTILLLPLAGSLYIGAQYIKPLIKYSGWEK